MMSEKICPLNDKSLEINVSIPRNKQQLNTRHTQFVQSDKNENERKICKLTVCLETPLELATREGHLQVCEVILSFKDKNPNSKMRHCKSWTPLHIAAVYGHLEICNAIMKQTADKNPVDSKGWTPLHCAAQEGHIQIIKAIHNHVVDKNPVDKEGLTPMALFLRHANAEDDMNDIIWE